MQGHAHVCARTHGGRRSDSDVPQLPHALFLRQGLPLVWSSPGKPRDRPVFTSHHHDCLCYVCSGDQLGAWTITPTYYFSIIFLFLRMNSTLLYKYATSSFTHSSSDGYLGHLFILTAVGHSTLKIEVHVSVCLTHSFLLCIYTKAESLNHVEFLCSEGHEYCFS